MTLMIDTKLAALRTAPGVEQWNVYVVSLGSKLALSVLRDHPQGIRSVVLDSVSPPTKNIVEVWWTGPVAVVQENLRCLRSAALVRRGVLEARS
ncbi:hypothetical protein QTI66_08930 [Variovorax sp. J22R133]|uniref:alpha/beta fold hydrolase n=1 Tax=Variovorax brevis TaxID=3053503 RepID=UPI0025749982|nr:alpha/beta fold hydrolase [Variovorax sp. J22R133]MDM0112273.1 hypothetical protein [Variovorax sp. J22R133]